jgi:hypothetical protein
MLEVSCASGEEGPDDEGRNQGKELGERVWQSWSWSRVREGGVRSRRRRWKGREILGMRQQSSREIVGIGGAR